jgi:hypothetical protein
MLLPFAAENKFYKIFAPKDEHCILGAKQNEPEWEAKRGRLNQVDVIKLVPLEVFFKTYNRIEMINAIRLIDGGGLSLLIEISGLDDVVGKSSPSGELQCCITLRRSGRDRNLSRNFV